MIISTGANGSKRFSTYLSAHVWHAAIYTYTYTHMRHQYMHIAIYTTYIYTYTPINVYSS